MLGLCLFKLDPIDSSLKFLYFICENQLLSSKFPALIQQTTLKIILKLYFLSVYIQFLFKHD